MQFDWDLANLEHIARHKVERDEAEEAVTDPAAVELPAHRGARGQPRVALVGATEAGRVLTVIVEDRNGRTRVVTARPPTATERRLYAT